MDGMAGSYEIGGWVCSAGEIAAKVGNGVGGTVGVTVGVGVGKGDGSFVVGS